MNTLKRAMWEMARSQGLEKCTDEARYVNTPNSQLPDGLIKVDDNLYKYPENPTTEDLLAMLICTTAKVEQHLRFIKNCFIVGIIIAIISALLGLIS